MTAIKKLAQKSLKKTVTFMDDKVEIRKLSLRDVTKIQEIAAEVKLQEGTDPNAELALLKSVIQLAVDGADELTDEEFDNFPLGEIADLANEILVYAGVNKPDAGN